MHKAIEVTHLDKHFGTLHAVRDVNFTVDRGEVLGFLGPNGAGKSTTMKMIAGFLEPSGGTVSVFGNDVVEDPIKVKRLIGYLPEGAPSYGEMTPTSFLDFVGEVRGLKPRLRRERIQHVVDKIHLEGVMQQRIETLSKGYKRRVGLAQAILHDPDVLILDEPTDGLDPNQKYEVRTLICEMAREKAIVVSTHILEEVDAVCTRAIIISSGKLMFDGTPEELSSMSTLHNAVSLLIDAAALGEARTRLSAIGTVASVEELAGSDGAARLLLRPRDGGTIVTEVAEVVHGAGWEVRELRVESGHLDEVFRTITTGNSEPRP